MTKRIVYASGSKGKTVRADGQGSFLARGWYIQKDDVPIQGPFKSENLARREAYGWNNI